LEHRMAWDDAFRGQLVRLDQKKPGIACGDFNVAKEEIDLKNPKANRGAPGFSDEERDKFRELLSVGFTDSFRHRNPQLAGAYTWWSYRFNARANNAGWRIDYVIASNRLMDTCTATPIFSDIFGSDHCPVGFEFEVEL